MAKKKRIPISVNDVPILSRSVFYWEEEILSRCSVWATDATVAIHRAFLKPTSRYSIIKKLIKHDGYALKKTTNDKKIDNACKQATHRVRLVDMVWEPILPWKTGLRYTKAINAAYQEIWINAEKLNLIRKAVNEPMSAYSNPKNRYNPIVFKSDEDGLPVAMLMPIQTSARTEHAKLITTSEGKR